MHLWRSEELLEQADKEGVLCFYGHGASNPYLHFSNFHEHRAFRFALPACCHRGDVVFSKVVDRVEFAEKAIMMCKAAVFGDYDIYDRLIHAYNPRDCKKLGRQVRNFDVDVWDAVVLTVAEEVVFQKFSKVRDLTPLLMRTGDSVIAESTRGDLNWATGANASDASAEKPWQWRGTNILGWALMQARARIRRERSSEATHG